MAQAFEYELLTSGTTLDSGGHPDLEAFIADLATKDTEGWDVIGFTAVDTENIIALLRRRV